MADGYQWLVFKYGRSSAFWQDDPAHTYTAQLCYKRYTVHACGTSMYQATYSVV